MKLYTAIKKDKKNIQHALNKSNPYADFYLKKCCSLLSLVSNSNHLTHVLVVKFKSLNCKIVEQRIKPKFISLTAMLNETEDKSDSWRLKRKDSLKVGSGELETG